MVNLTLSNIITYLSTPTSYSLQMKRQYLPLAIAAMALAGHSAMASTAYGDLNNFDVVNDTNQPCHGFEIELDGVHSEL